jgi:hypothetical protein
MKLAVLLLLTSLAAAQCEKASWVVKDDGIAGGVSKEGKPLKHAKVHVSGPDLEYSAITDDEGMFSISPVALGKTPSLLEGGERGNWRFKAGTGAELIDPAFTSLSTRNV